MEAAKSIKIMTMTCEGEAPDCVQKYIESIISILDKSNKSSFILKKLNANGTF